MIDIERLLQALGIVAKRKGHEWEALCPYHQDKKPSWSIRDQPGSERHGRHHCWSCQAGGSAQQLAADLLDIDRQEAGKWLVESGITATPDVPIETSIDWKKDAMAVVVEVPVGVSFVPLEKWPSAARDFALSRGLTAEQVARWGIGYAIVGRCRGRIWIPVRDGRNVLHSWMARSYTGSALRYLTPTREEAPVRDGVFGTVMWQDQEQVVVCEGALNALACERAGARNVAAIGGSNVTALQLAALSTFKQILVLTDPDEAGDKAAATAVAALGRWRAVLRIELPRGQDANALPEAELRKILTDPWP